ncbi:MAG: hypothetical protein RPU13_07560 [Candidatus Sedimenticola sp. (ex Thyasira tokunagai)]
MRGSGNAWLSCQWIHIRLPDLSGNVIEALSQLGQYMTLYTVIPGLCIRPCGSENQVKLKAAALGVDCDRSIE